MFVNCYLILALSLVGFTSSSCNLGPLGAFRILQGACDIVDRAATSIIYESLIRFEESGIELPLLKTTIGQLSIPPGVLRRNRFVPALQQINACVACSSVFRYFTLRTRLGLSRNLLVRTLTFACTLFQIESEEICRGVIELNIDYLIYIVKEKKDLNEDQACSILLQPFNCNSAYSPKWSVYIPPGNSIPRFNGDSETENALRVLHITDIHVDDLYQEGAIANCKEPLCCQKDKGNATNPTDGAGRWGDYRNCDMPFYAFEELLRHIKAQNNQLTRKISYVYFTGDIISHRVWETSKAGNIENIKKVYKALRDAFYPIPIYPILGNHEPHPLNVFSPPTNTDESLSTSWVFQLMADEWSTLLPNDTFNTIRYGGYYTVLAKPGFRIIALNSNVCYIFNWWLLYENKDPFNQLQWLTVVLTEAEAKNESVHILSHIPPGDNTCLREWLRQYRRIVERFAYTITGQFNGHTHFDELKIFYNSSKSDQAINIAYNGGSFTSFNDLNPNYRYYDIDTKTYEVVDYEQWMYDVDEANASPDTPPKWFKLYSFKDAYGLPSAKPQVIANMVSRMPETPSLMDQYQRFKVRHARPALITECSRDCHRENYCGMVTTELDDTTMCDLFR